MAEPGDHEVVHWERIDREMIRSVARSVGVRTDSGSIDRSGDEILAEVGWSVGRAVSSIIIVSDGGSGRVGAGNRKSDGISAYFDGFPY